ncbi:putative pore coat assembly factor [Tupanvirus deep ocean]|uniref:Pore coat assembly factor n=2 Tax=Tupanvirus TaxID=2094720 RepID=A0AC62A906_9VIRU|nr:putative pore coat assembly factor [Tupanvirus deep ocean]QKU34140.1 putative pore coat assembly factor [Tupanvirus deep ocean]
MKLAISNKFGYNAYLENNRASNTNNFNAPTDKSNIPNGIDIYNKNSLELNGHNQDNSFNIPVDFMSNNFKNNNSSNNKMEKFSVNDLNEIYAGNKNLSKKQKIKTISKKTKRNNGRSNSNEKNLIDVSEKLTDNAYSIRRILRENVNGNNKCSKRKQRPMDLVRSNKWVGIDPSMIVDNGSAEYPSKNEPENQPQYLSQFEAQTFDSEGLPSAPNDIYSTNDKAKLADLERKLSYKEGWSQYDQQGSMTYGIVADDQLTHDNMMPFFSTRHGYGTNDLRNEAVMDYKNQLFTGNLKSTWNKKQEVMPFFAPAKNLTFVYGTPVRSEDEITRYIPGRYHQNEVPFEQKRVTPGLNLEPDEVGTHGYHSMVRVFDKTVDELRVKPKITYEGRIIDGMRGQERPIQAPVIKYRPDTYKITTEDDLLPTDNIVDGPRTRDNFIMKETDRAGQHFEYTGGAYNKQDAVQQNVPEYMRPKIKYSEKSTFVLPKPLQKFSKVETQFNPNLNSYDTSATLKDLTINNDYVGAINNVPGSATYTNMMDVAKPTIKEITAETPQTHTNIMPNTMRGTVQPMDIANTTIKETTIDNKLNPHAASLSSMQRVYYNDVAKTTIKETTCEPVVPMNTGQMINIYANLTDNAKETIKETTVGIPYQTTITPINQQQRAPNPQDIARATTKETTVTIPYQTTITPINQQQRAPNPQDIARATTKETTVGIPYQTTITPINQQQRAPNPQDIARATTKETTVTIPYQTTITPVNQQQRAPNPQDIARTTIRETTVGIPYQTTITPINQQQRAPNPQDIARATTKETTVGIPYQTTITPINQQQRAPNPQDVARTTVRETIVQTPWNNFMTPINQQQRAPDPQDVARTTLKETTVGIPYQTTITPINQQQRAPDPQDVARTTTRETTVGIPYQTTITPVNQQQRAPNPQDIARSTVKETTVGIPYQTTITPINQQQRAPNPQDIARTTTRETTVGIPYQTTITPINQQQRAPNPQDVARTTTRETTIGIPYQTTITPINQQQRAPNPQDIARATIKETTVGIPYQTTITPINQQQRAPNLQDIAKTTIRETTVGIPYQTTITPINQQQRAPNPQDVARTTTRETTVGIPYQTVLTPINQQQRAPNPQDVARTTTRETTVGIPYQTVLTPVNQHQRAPNPQDVAKTTTRETTVTIPYNTHTTGIDRQQGRASAFDRTQLRTTTKEQTIGIPRNTHLVAVGQAQRAPNPQDVARTTIKEQTVQIPYNTQVVAVGQAQRAPDPQDGARTTTKETTVTIPYNTNTTAIGQANGQASTFDRTPLKSTVKETTIDNEYIGGANNDVYGKGYGYMAENMYAPNTNKQFTCQEVYITPAEGESKNRSYNDAYNAEIDDRKELLHWYYEPTKCGVNMGPDPNHMNLQLKIDDNRNHGPMIGYSVNNQLDRLKSQAYLKPTDNVCSDRFMDPMLLKQLESNPYNIPFYGNSDNN